MSTTYTAAKPLKPNTPIPVLERDENGTLIGAYTGYWNYKHETVRLYPNVRHPGVWWRGTPAKKLISDRAIKVIEPTGTSTSVTKAAVGVKDNTAKLRRLPITGQEKMKF